ncbi:Uncharacterised protein [Yersinia intermedia]|nr:Uncharacterised protein [Yersinia intermedia]
MAFARGFAGDVQAVGERWKYLGLSFSNFSQGRDYYYQTHKLAYFCDYNTVIFIHN